MTLVDRIADAASEAGKTAEEYLTDKFRSFAVDSGWPQEVANLCSVIHDSYTFHVRIDGESVDRVLDWELGTPDRPGIQAIQRFTNRLDEHGSYYADQLFDSLVEKGVI